MDKLRKKDMNLEKSKFAIKAIIVCGVFAAVCNHENLDSLKTFLGGNPSSLSNNLSNPNSTKTTQVSDWLITDLKWGSLKVGSQSFKDCRIWPNNAEEWDWNKTGTRHKPGIQIEDLADFIDNIDTIVLSEGVDGVLQIKPDTLEFLKKANKDIFIARTPMAVEKYNELLTKGERVGALIHTTC